jgi:Zn finger protein HypA/HybF involved in hydrogenase expression
MEEKINKEDEMFTVLCIHCNDQEFKFSKNLLEKNEIMRLICPRCNGETKITYKNIGGVIIGKY